MKRKDFASGEERDKPTEFKEDEIEVVIDKEERYPDFECVSESDMGPTAWNGEAAIYARHKITREQYEWIVKTSDEYDRVQQFLSKLSNWEE